MGYLIFKNCFFLINLKALFALDQKKRFYSNCVTCDDKVQTFQTCTLASVWPVLVWLGLYKHLWIRHKIMIHIDLELCKQLSWKIMGHLWSTDHKMCLSTPFCNKELSFYNTKDIEILFVNTFTVFQITMQRWLMHN